MKDLVRAALVLGSMLALVLGARVAIYTHQHSDTAAVMDPAPIAAAERDCGVMAVKMPCFRHANPQGGATASAPVQSGPASAETIAAREARCAAQQVKFPCLHTDSRS